MGNSRSEDKRKLGGVEIMTILKGKTRRAFAFALNFALAFAVIFSNNTVFYANAGASMVYVVSSASVRGDEINEGDFKIEGSVYAKDGKVVFGETAAKSARLLAKTKINNLKDYGVTELFDMSATFEFADLQNGGKATFLFGLKKANSGAGSEGSGEVAFTYDNTDNCMCIEVNEYLSANLPTAVAKKGTYKMLLLGTAITFKMSVDVDGRVYASVSCEETDVDNLKILDGKTLNIDPQGYVAFASSAATDGAKSEFRISDISVTAFAYDVVETVEHYKETFDGNSYNANMFYSQTTNSPIYPAKIAVEDGKLVFRNVGQGYFTTKEKYSNFELKFDIVDLYREGKKDSNGKITQLISNWFMIGFGVDNVNDPPNERIAATFLHFYELPLDIKENRSNHYTGKVDNGMKDNYFLWDNGSAVADAVQSMSGTGEGQFSLWDKDYIGDETVNLKLTVVDGLITLYYKLESDREYVKQYEYYLGTMQTGYVRIYSYGDGSGSVTEFTGVLNMTIDNFEITDLDAVKLVKAAPVYRSNVQPRTSDYIYTTVTDDSDLLNNKLKNN